MLHSELPGRLSRWERINTRMNHVEVKRRQIQAFSYILSLITLIAAGRILGDHGVAYLAVAVESFTFLLLILAHNVPDTLGRMLRNRNTKGQYKNAAKIRKIIMLFQCGAGFIGSTALFLLSDLLEQNVWKVPYTSFLMKISAPVLFLRVISGVLEGYFQGSGTEMPTVAVSVLRQIFWLGLGLLFGNILQNYGEKVSALLLNDRISSMYGAAGFLLGMLLTEALLLLFLFLIYMASRRKTSGNGDGLKMTERFGSSVGALYGNMINSILIYLLIKLPIWLGLLLLMRNTENNTRSVVEFGVYYGKYLTVCALPVILTEALMLPLIARVSANFRREEYRFARDVYGIGLHISVVYTLFAAVFTAVLAEQIAKVFFTEEVLLAAQMLRTGSSLIIFVVLAAYFLRVLITTGKQILVLSVMGIYGISSCVGLVICLKAIKQGSLGLVWSGIACTAILCILSAILAFRQMHAKPELIPHLAVPAAASGVTGLLFMLLGKFVTPHLGDLVTLILCLALGLLVYWLILLLLRSFRPYELDLIPAGGLLKKLARLIHVL